MNILLKAFTTAIILFSLSADKALAQTNIRIQG
jgi:hypothetical protein